MDKVVAERAASDVVARLSLNHVLLTQRARLALVRAIEAIAEGREVYTGGRGSLNGK